MAAVFTHRAPESVRGFARGTVRYLSAQMAVAHVPKNSGATITCSRSADAGGERADVQGVGSSFHSLPRAQTRRRTRYRGVIVAAALNGCHRDDRRCERSRGQLCEACCRTCRQLHQHRSRRRCRRDRGPCCGCRCAAKPRPATLGCMATKLGGMRCRRSRLARSLQRPRTAPARSAATPAFERARGLPVPVPTGAHIGRRTCHPL